MEKNKEEPQDNLEALCFRLIGSQPSQASKKAPAEHVLLNSITEISMHLLS